MGRIAAWIFSTLLVLPALVFAADYDNLMETSLVNSDRLGLEVDERVYEIGSGTYVTDKFTFYLPYFESGEDAEITKNYAIATLENGQLKAYPVEGEDFLFLYLGSYGLEKQCKEGFMENLMILFNGKGVRERGQLMKGWRRMAYADGSENILIYLQKDCFNFGGENTLEVYYNPKSLKAGAGNYYECLGLDIGRFYSVINVSAEVNPLVGGNYSVTFRIRNSGKAKEAGELQLDVFMNSFKTRNAAIYDSGASGEGFDYTLESCKGEEIGYDCVGSIKIKKLNFSDSDEKNITLHIEAHGLEPGEYAVFPAYSYMGREAQFLEEGKIVKRENVLIVGSGNNTCRYSGSVEDCGFREGVESLAKAFAYDSFTVEVLEISNCEYDAVWEDWEKITNCTERVRSEIWGHLTKKEIDEGVYVILLGNFEVIPPCVYEDELAGGFIYSDHCYSIREDGSYPEIPVSRIPYSYIRKENGTLRGNLGNYLEGMAEYHLSHPHMEKKNSSHCFSAIKMKETQKENLFDGEGVDWYPAPLVSGTEHLAITDSGEVLVNSYPAQFYFLHSGFANVWWEDSDKEIVVSETSWPNGRFILFSAACHGANPEYVKSVLYRWMLSDKTSIPNAYIGATRESYFGAYPGFPVGSDLLASYFYDGLLEGDSAGAAFLSAKRRMQFYDYREASAWNEILGIVDATFKDNKIDKMNNKVLIEFGLYGDPTIGISDLCGEEYID